MEDSRCDKDSTMSWFLSSLLPYSPRHARKSWMRINAFILAWTLLSFVEIMRTLEPEKRLSGTRSYLIYNTTVCFIWTIECGLHFLEYQHDKHFPHVLVCGQPNDKFQPEKEHESSAKEEDDDNQYEIYLIMIELMLAAYYLYDAVVTFCVLWLVPNFNIGTELFDVLLDMVAYTYLTLRLTTYTESINKEANPAEVSKRSTSPDGETMDYVGMKDNGYETGV